MSWKSWLGSKYKESRGACIESVPDLCLKKCLHLRIFETEPWTISKSSTLWTAATGWPPRSAIRPNAVTCKGTFGTWKLWSCGALSLLNLSSRMRLGVGAAAYNSMKIEEIRNCANFPAIVPLQLEALQKCTCVSRWFCVWCKLGKASWCLGHKCETHKTCEIISLGCLRGRWIAGPWHDEKTPKMPSSPGQNDSKAAKHGRHYEHHSGKPPVLSAKLKQRQQQMAYTALEKTAGPVLLGWETANEKNPAKMQDCTVWEESLASEKTSAEWWKVR